MTRRARARRQVRAKLRVKGRATIQGRLALAVLGRRAFDDEVLGKDLTRYDALLEMLKAAPEKSDGGSRSHTRPQRGRSLGSDARRGRERGWPRRRRRTSPSEAPLRDADRLARQLTGAVALKGGPAEEARKRRMHDLLVWMAGRTLEDHWFDGAAAPSPTIGRPASASRRTPSRSPAESRAVAVDPGRVESAGHARDRGPEGHRLDERAADGALL